MKNQNKANAGRTQIADISVAGKELSEEHLQVVVGGLPIWGGGVKGGAYRMTYKVALTYSSVAGEYPSCTYDYSPPELDSNVGL